MSANIRVNASVVKESIKSRVDCAETMGSQMKQAPFYNIVKASCDSVVAEGAQLAAAEAAVHSALAVLANARDLRDSAILKFDGALNVLISDVEKNAATPGDVTSLALTVLDRQSYTLEVPSGITVKHDPAKGVVRVLVDLPPGAASCLLEVSTDPTNPASWKRVPGDGARRALAGYAPGTYWFRAASLRANDESAFTAPVSIVVK
jgi:hypothetical protein